jgi:nitrile hydratase alpha subunit
MDNDDQATRINNVIAKASTDEDFKQRLLTNQAASLRDEGVEIPPGVEVRVLEDTDQVRHLVLPMKPSGEAAAAALPRKAVMNRA